MPVDELAGEVVGAAVTFVGEVVVEVVPQPPRSGRLRRILYWSVITLMGGLLLVGFYFALG